MKRQLVLLTASIFALASCANGISSDSASDSSDSSIAPLPTTAKNVIQVLEDACQKKNYQLDYTVSGSSYTEIITENYLYYVGSKAGLVRMDNPSKEIFNKEKALFNFEVDEGGRIEITRATVQNGIPYFSVSELDALQLIGSESFTLKESDFSQSTLNEDALYSKNEKLLYVMSYLSGIESLATSNTLFGVDFWIAENGLNFKFVTYDDNDNLTYYDASGLISAIGSAKEENLDAYFSSIGYRFDESISEKSVSNVKKDSLYSKATVTYSSGTSSSQESSIEVNYTSDYLEVTSTSSSATSDSVLYRGGNNEVVEKYLDGTNHILEKVLSEEDFDSYLTTAQDVIEPSLFRKIADKKYRYYGFYPESLLYAFMQSSTESYQINTIDVLLNDSGEIQEIDAYSTIYESDNGNQQYIIRISDFGDSRALKQIKTLEPISGVKEKLLPAFEKLKFQATSGNGIQLSMTDSMLSELNEKTDFYYTKDVIVTDKKYSETTSNPNPDDHEYSGYYQTDDGLASFYINKTSDSVVPTADLNATDTIAKHWFDLIFNFSTDVFEFDKSDKTNRTFKLRDEVTYVKDQFGFLWGRNNSNIDPSTVKLVLNEDGYLAEIHFSFSSFANREATIVITYGTSSNPVTVPSYVVEKLKTVSSWSYIDSWKKESGTIYQQLVGIFGEEFANGFPYYFSEDTSTNWRSLQISPVSIKIYNLFNDKYYFASFGRTLVSNGYQSLGNGVYENDQYDVKVTLGSNTQEGMIIEKI